MKKSIFTLAISLVITITLLSCGNNTQSQSIKEATDLKEGIQKMMPGGIATTANGYMMTAKINGKIWTATSMMSPDIAGRIIGDNNGESISLPYYDRKNFLNTPKNKFSDHNAVDLVLHDDVGIYGGYKGEMEITRVDANWAEGKFFFTGSTGSSGKTVEVTDGFFRIPFPQKK